MSDEHDPPRLSESASGAPLGLTELFRQAKDDLPKPAELAELSARIDAATSPSPPATTPGAPFTRLGPKASLGLVGGLLGIVALSVWLSRPAAVPSPAASTGAPAARVSVPPARVSAPAAVGTEPASASPVNSDKGAAVSDETAPPKDATARGNGAVPGNAAPNTASPQRTSRAGGEAELLEAARAALGSNPARALLLTREHQRRFARGLLVQEREVIAIEALRRLGDAKAAGQRADAFGRQYPGSPHRRSVESKPQ